MAQKIDSTEGVIMTDLEGMESKRLDQASKISNEFEDRWENGLFCFTVAHRDNTHPQLIVVCTVLRNAMSAIICAAWIFNVSLLISITVFFFNFFRFKHHMIDLLFMEKIARWLTNTQVRIKSEVADSNSQAQKLAQFLNDLERRIDACEYPNLDKEVHTFIKFTLFSLIRKSTVVSLVCSHLQLLSLGSVPETTER